MLDNSIGTYAISIIKLENGYIYQHIQINLLQKREMNGIRIVNMKKSAH